MAKILITGGSGLLGKTISKLLLKKGYEVNWLSRKPGEWQGIKKYIWNLEESVIDLKAFEGVDTLIHLAGTGIVDKRWTESYKRDLLNSRVKSSELLFDTIQKNKFPIKTFIGASAIGYYGLSESPKLYIETDEAAKDYLAELTKNWENSYLPFKQSGIRTAVLRIGIVLSKEGGFYAKMAPVYKLGIGTSFGKGNYYLSWIHLKDLCSLILYAIENENCKGVYNAVASNPIRYSEFSKQLAISLNRPLIFPHLPEILIKSILGERAVMLTKGVKVSNAKIKNQGFKFEFDELNTALTELKS